METEIRKYKNHDGSLYLMVEKDTSATWGFIIDSEFKNILGDSWLWNGPKPDIGWHPLQDSNPALPMDKGERADIELTDLSVEWIGSGKNQIARIYCVKSGCYLASVFYGRKGGESIFCKQNNKLANVSTERII